MYKPGDRVLIPSGMGGTFDAILINKDGKRWWCRVDMPLNPGWDKYLLTIDGKLIIRRIK